MSDYIDVDRAEQLASGIWDKVKSSQLPIVMVENQRFITNKVGILMPTTQRPVTNRFYRVIFTDGISGRYNFNMLINGGSFRRVVFDYNFEDPSKSLHLTPNYIVNDSDYLEIVVYFTGDEFISMTSIAQLNPFKSVRPQTEHSIPTGPLQNQFPPGRYFLQQRDYPLEISGIPNEALARTNYVDRYVGYRLDVVESKPYLTSHTMNDITYDIDIFPYITQTVTFDGYRHNGTTYNTQVVFTRSWQPYFTTNQPPPANMTTFNWQRVDSTHMQLDPVSNSFSLDDLTLAGKYVLTTSANNVTQRPTEMNTSAPIYIEISQHGDRCIQKIQENNNVDRYFIRTRPSFLAGFGEWKMVSISDNTYLETLINKWGFQVDATLPFGNDVNDYRKTGVYYFSGTTHYNHPSGSNGWLLVLNSGSSNNNESLTNNTKQVWFRAGTATTNDWETYVRLFSSATGGFGEWTRFATAPELDMIGRTIRLTGTADMNDYKNTGKYYIVGTGLNRPPQFATGGLFFDVINDNATNTGSAKQIAYRNSSANTSHYMTASRQYSSATDTWTDWVRISPVNPLNDTPWTTISYVNGYANADTSSRFRYMIRDNILYLHCHYVQVPVGLAVGQTLMHVMGNIPSGHAPSAIVSFPVSVTLGSLAVSDAIFARGRITTGGQIDITYHLANATTSTTRFSIFFTLSIPID